MSLFIGMVQELLKSLRMRPALPPLKTDLTGKTVVVVGANAGLGFEACKHFASMRPNRLILGCRSASRGKEAIQKLTEETGFAKAELMLIDLNDFSSIKTFVQRLGDARVDVVVENAGVWKDKYDASQSTGWEESIQVNVLGAMYLSILLMSRLRSTATEYAVVPRLCIVTSNVHYIAKIPKEILAKSSILEAMSERRYYSLHSVMRGRYFETKLLITMLMCSLAEHTPSSKVIVNGPNPNFCASDLQRHLQPGPNLWAMKIFEKLFAFTAEEGSRQLVWAALADEASVHGAYIEGCKVVPVAENLMTEEGKRLRERVWDEVIGILEKVDPSIASTLEVLSKA